MRNPTSCYVCTITHYRGKDHRTPFEHGSSAKTKLERNPTILDQQPLHYYERSDLMEHSTSAINLRCRAIEVKSIKEGSSQWRRAVMVHFFRIRAG
ncbi:uncharacterized protein LOC105699986 isoform X2 [Orussus abietinus]|uniref:uncharacterized protein LOC105699986 isoform X2 n=1 Tax=Orussus abietinus TaxID=222816 RepID=UPI000626A684|nr:uncharacterized protein LOC105699986 isoform X2 [Orussus abietinus]